MKYLWYLCLFIAVSLPLHAESINLLQNSDFEAVSSNKPVYWYVQSFKSGSKISVTTEKKHNGKLALKIQNLHENDARVIQYVTVEPNTTYLFSGWIATQGITEGRVGANLSIITSSDRSQGLNGDRDWTFVQYYFKTNANQRGVTIGPRLGTWGNIVSGTAWFDDLTLTKIGAIPKTGRIKTLTDNSPILYSSVHKRSQKRYLAVLMVVFILAGFICTLLVLKKKK